ncbi:AP-3 complex subunit mu-2, partial [Perkinsus olseni]
SNGVTQVDGVSPKGSANEESEENQAPVEPPEVSASSCPSLVVCLTSEEMAQQATPYRTPLAEFFSLEVIIDGCVYHIPLPGHVECETPTHNIDVLVTRKPQRKRLGRLRGRSERRWPSAHHSRPSTAPERRHPSRGRSSWRDLRADLSYIPPRSGLSPLKRKHILLGRISDISKLCRMSGLKGLPDTTTPKMYARQFLNLPVDTNLSLGRDDAVVVVSAIIDWLEEPLGSLWHFHIELGDKPGSPSTLFFVHDGLKNVTNLHPDHLPMMRLIEFYLYVSQRCQQWGRRSVADTTSALSVEGSSVSHSKSVIALLERSIKRVHVRAQRFITLLKCRGGVSALGTWQNWANFQDYELSVEDEVGRLGRREVALIEDEVHRQRDRLVLGMRHVVARLGVLRLDGFKLIDNELGSRPGFPALYRVVAVAAQDMRRKAGTTATNDGVSADGHSATQQRPRSATVDENWGILGAKSWLRATYQPVKLSEYSEDDISSDEAEKDLPMEDKRFQKLTRKLEIDPNAARMIQAAFTSFTAEGSRTMDKKAFLQLCRRCILYKVSEHTSMDSVTAEWFDEVDADDDGRASLKDILKWYKKFSLHRDSSMRIMRRKQQPKMKRKKTLKSKVRAIMNISKSCKGEGKVHENAREAGTPSRPTSTGEEKNAVGMARVKSQKSVRIEATEDSEVDVPKHAISRWLQSSATVGSSGCDANSEASMSARDRVAGRQERAPLPVIRGSERDMQLYRQQQEDIADEIRHMNGASPVDQPKSQTFFKAAVGLGTNLRRVDRQLVEEIKAGVKAPRPRSREAKLLLKRKPDVLRPLTKVCSQRRVCRRHRSLGSYRKLFRTLFNKRDKCSTNSLYGIVPKGSKGSPSSCALIYIYREYIYLGAIVSLDISPLLIFGLLDTVYSVLLYYCSAAVHSTSLAGPSHQAVDEELLRDNFSTVAILLDEMIDGPGLPFTTDKATLEAMLPPPTMLGKFISAVAGTSAKMATDRQEAVAAPSSNLSLGVPPLGSSNFVTSAVSTMLSGVTNAMAASSGALVNATQKEASIDIGGQYWWRPNSPSYTSNELYVDVVETFNCIVDEKGCVLDGDVAGDISVISRLSGPDPHAVLTVRNPDLLSQGTVHFHPCVDLEKWRDDQKVSFDRGGGCVDFKARPRVSASLLNSKENVGRRPSEGHVD